MAEDDNEDTQSSSEDRIIDSRAFQLGGGVDLGAFISSDDLAEAKRPALPGGSPTDATAGTQEKVVVDENQDDAIGEIFEIFDQDSGPKAGDILPDGTVYDTPELDTITEVAVQGERRLHWALMVTMIVVYSLIGWPSMRIIGAGLTPHNLEGPSSLWWESTSWLDIVTSTMRLWLKQHWYLSHLHQLQVLS